MADGSAGFRQDLTCPALLRIPLGITYMPCTGLSPAMVQLSRRVPLCMQSPRCGPTTPGPPERSRFGLSPVRSPLLGGSLFVFFSSGYLDVSVPRVSSRLTAGNRSSTGWVAPFGNPRITGHYAPPHGLSQPIASFIASESQGIHHTPLVTFRPLMVLLGGPISRSVLVSPTIRQRTVRPFEPFVRRRLGQSGH